MPIAPIPPISTLSSSPVGAASATTPAATGNDAFSNIVSNAVDALQQTQTAATQAEALSAAGQGNLADTMIAASKASVETQVTTSLLDKAVGSYNDIMNMAF